MVLDTPKQVYNKCNSSQLHYSLNINIHEGYHNYYYAIKF